jgi:hypothetical protein
MMMPDFGPDPGADDEEAPEDALIGDPCGEPDETDAGGEDDD